LAERRPQSWLAAEPEIAERERTAMDLAAPELQWREDLTWRDGREACGWVGPAPQWAADRACPAGVAELLGTRRLELKVVYPEAFPAVPAELFPVDPEVPLERRTLGQWHVNGNGSLCLMQAAADWQPTDTAADLVRKASGWLIEYLLLEAGAIESMSVRGLFADTVHDAVLAELVK
jgi:hypothetical protein